jgi:predicted 3-demethylubiquinone-9 3-methyltransferase (glyoxalase superfamily)
MDEALAFYQEHMDVVIQSENRQSPDAPRFTATFTIYGHEFIGLNWPGGPEFNDSISLSVNVDGQEEVDRLWNSITEKGQAGQCGWCKDAWGVSWQITPIQMGDHLENPDREKANYAMEQLRKMTKIVIADFIQP